VPAVIVSPLVAPASVCQQQFDHTSVLQFLAELFTPGQPFSGPVDNRRKQGIASISVALGDAPRPESPPAPSQVIPVTTALGGRVALPQTDMQKALEQAANALMSNRPQETGKKYPELFQWKAAADAARGVK
jgi:phospholipase C